MISILSGDTGARSGYLVAEKDPANKLAPRSIRNLYGMLHTMTHAWSG